MLDLQNKKSFAMIHLLLSRRLTCEDLIEENQLVEREKSEFENR